MSKGKAYITLHNFSNWVKCAWTNKRYTQFAAESSPKHTLSYSEYEILANTIYKGVF